MAVSPILLKGIAGLGAASTVTIGGIYLYKNGFGSGYSKLEKTVLDSNSGWAVSKKDSSTIQNGHAVEMEVKWTGTVDGKNKTWSCKIQGIIKTHADGNTVDIDSQKTTLEKELGIKEANSRTSNKNYSFRKFFENCRKSDTKSTTETGFTSTLKTKDITAGTDKKYKFDDAELQKLYGGSGEILEKLGLKGKTWNSNEDQNVPTTIKFAGQTSFTIPTDLKIKIEETEDANFPEGLKFTLVSTSAIDSIGVKANTNTEFKIKIDGDNYSLEKAWDIEKWASKVNLSCEKTTKTCTLKNEQKINVWKDENDYITGASFAGNIKFEEGQDNHSQGFKFSVESDTNLSEGTKKKESGGISKLTKENKSYEIGIKTIDSAQKPFLIEK